MTQNINAEFWQQAASAVVFREFGAWFTEKTALEVT
jgi:hypothetical protein